MRTVILLLALAAAPALAEEPMNAEEFERATEGATLYYRSAGQDYGIEEYLPGRRVRWSFLDGECIEGEWYQAGEMICFDYEELDTDQCWSFYQSGSGLMALFENDPGNTLIFETRRTTDPMLCLGPKVGA